MSETLTQTNPNRRAALLAAGGLIISLGLTACSEQGEPLWATDYGIGLPRCYDEAQPRKEKLGDIRLPEQPPTRVPLTVREDKRGNIADYPGPISKKAATTVDKAAVLIRNTENGSVGNGFVTTASNGDKVVSTVAHAVTAGNPRALVVIDRNNKGTSVLGGCFMHEEEGEMTKSSGKHASPIDIAVLKVDPAFTKDKPALKVSSTLVGRGLWGNVLAGRNHRTNGFVSSGLLSLGHMVDSRTIYLSGVQSGKACEPGGTPEEPPVCSAQPGNSGSAIYNRKTNAVTGVLTGGYFTENRGYLGRDELAHYFGVNAQISMGPNSGHWPTVATVTDGAILQKALNSPRATQRYSASEG
jgi:hypothetical protein